MLIQTSFLKCCCIFLFGYYTAKVIRYLKKEKLVEFDKLLFLLKIYIFGESSYKENEEIKKFFYQNLENAVIEQHGKHFNISEISINSFLKLFQTKILIIGIGGLGSPALLYLNKFGFAEIGLVDGDTVESSNLHRQIIHKGKCVGINKCISAKYTLEEMEDDKNVPEKRKMENQNSLKNTERRNFPHVKKSRIVCYPVYLNKENAFDIIKQYDIILDCTDNISTRFLINDICVLFKKKLIFGSATGLYGQVNVFNFTERNSNCYRCMKTFNNHKENVDCDENGILSTVTGVIGILQANEAIKLATGLNNKVLKTYLTFNSFSNFKPFETLNINRKNGSCICAKLDFHMLLAFIRKHNYQENNVHVTETLLSSQIYTQKLIVLKNNMDDDGKIDNDYNYNYNNDGNIDNNYNYNNEKYYNHNDNDDNDNDDKMCIEDEKYDELPQKAESCQNVANISDTKYEYDIDAVTFCEILKNNLNFFPFEVNHVRILDVRKENNVNIYGLKNSVAWDFYDITEILGNYLLKQKKGKDKKNDFKNTIEQIFNKLQIVSFEGTVVVIVICRRGINSLHVTKLFNELFVFYNTNKMRITTDKKNCKELICSKIQKIWAYNMKGGYFQLRKKVYTDMPFL